MKHRLVGSCLFPLGRIKDGKCRPINRAGVGSLDGLPTLEKKWRHTQLKKDFVRCTKPKK